MNNHKKAVKQRVRDTRQERPFATETVWVGGESPTVYENRLNDSNKVDIDARDDQ